jgi:hypothetical protein
MKGDNECNVVSTNLNMEAFHTHELILVSNLPQVFYNWEVVKIFLIALFQSPSQEILLWVEPKAPPAALIECGFLGF